MTTIDPVAAIARALSVSSWRGSGLCLDFVDWCMGRPGSRLGDNGGPPNGSWQEAKDGWYYSEHQHPGDMNPPAGVPCYWETGPSGNTAGHIVISLGGGLCRTTDYGGAATVTTTSIASITRARRTARYPDGGYLGWTEDHGGNPIAGITGTIHADAALIREDDTMSAQDVAELKGFINDKLTHGNAGLRLIQCTQRGIAVVGAGYFKGLTEEELPYAVSLWGWPEDYADNPRAFDLAVAISLNGVTATDSEIADVQKVLAEQAAKADQNAAVIAGLAHLAGN